MGLFFQEERDSDFYKACEEVRRVFRDFNVSDIAKIAIYKPTESFYLTTKGYTKVIHRIRTGKEFPEVRKELYIEIQKRMKLIENVDNLKASQIARILDSQPAPRFYISESRAKTIYYNKLREYAVHRSNNLNRDTFFSK